MSDTLTTEYGIKLFGILSAIGIAVWRFIKWTLGVDSRLKLLETQMLKSDNLYNDVRETMQDFSLKMEGLATKVSLLIDDKIK